MPAKPTTIQPLLANRSRSKFHFTLNQDSSKVIGTATREVWVDSSRGYIPLKLIQNLHLNTAKGKVTTLQCDADYEWSLMSDVWVPVHWQYTGGGGATKGSYEFNWKEVNMPLSSELFTLERFNLPNGTLVVDKTLGESVIDHFVGGKNVAIVGDRVLDENGSSSLRFWMILANVAAIVVIAWAVYVRYRHRVNVNL